MSCIEKDNKNTKAYKYTVLLQRDGQITNRNCIGDARDKSNIYLFYLLFKINVILICS